MSPLTVGAGLWLGAIAATGVYTDIRFRSLPNWLCALALVSGMGFGLALGGWQEAAFALLHALIALVVGIGLFALGGIGAGDAKYYAALAAWFSLWDGITLLTSVALAGLLLLMVWAAWRLRRSRKIRSQPGDDPFDKLPYGVAIAVGAAAAYAAVHFDLW